jgi:spermidine synthase
MLSHPDPKKVLIIGGGDGGALREVLRHNVDKAVLVELDPLVLEVARRYFPNLSVSFEDPRAEVIPEEGVGFVRNSVEQFDVIVVDSPDPIGFAKQLFSKDFYESSSRILGEHGVFVVQSESPILHLDLIMDIQKKLKVIFKDRKLYLTVVPTYPGALWSFSMGSNDTIPNVPLRTPPPGLKVYSEEAHRAAFGLPPFLKDALF